MLTSARLLSRFCAGDGQIFDYPFFSSRSCSLPLGKNRGAARHCYGISLKRFPWPVEVPFFLLFFMRFFSFFFEFRIDSPEERIAAPAVSVISPFLASQTFLTRTFRRCRLFRSLSPHLGRFAGGPNCLVAGL